MQRLNQDMQMIQLGHKINKK